MSKGEPRNRRDIISVARDMGYEYSYSKGGHDFYVNDSFDPKIGQVKKMTIPTDIKTEKTRRSILKGIGYYASQELGNEARDTGPSADELQSRYIKENRRWKTQMKQHMLSLIHI